MSDTSKLFPSLAKQHEGREHKQQCNQAYWMYKIQLERESQDAKWGFPQENTYCEWAGILAEEMGELAKELNELNFGRGDVKRMQEEAVQVAAVALSILEHQEVAHRVTEAWNACRNREGSPDGA